MPLFTAKLDDGSTVTLEADHEPSEQDVLAAVQQEERKAKVSAPTAFLEHGAAGVGPGAAFMAAFPTGARLGLAAGAMVPGAGETGVSEAIGAGIGGMVAGSIAAWAAAKGIRKGVQTIAPKFEKRFEEQLAAGEEQHPIASMAGEIASLGPSAKLAPFKLAQLPLRAALGAGISAGVPLLQGRKPTAADIGAGAISTALYGEARFKAPFAKELSYASRLRENAGQVQTPGLEQQGREGQGRTDLERGTPQQPSGTPSPLPQETQVLLNQGIENNRSLGIGHQLEIVPDFGPQDPTHRKVFQATPPTVDAAGKVTAPGRIRMSQEAFNQWLAFVPEAEKAKAIHSALAEEGIHATITPQMAAEYLKTLTPAEIAAGKKLYLGNISEAEAGLNEANLGHELLRQRMQRLLRMTPTELAETTGAEKWSRATIEAIARVIRSIREFFGTKAAQAGRVITDELLNRYQDNLNAVAKNSGEPQPFPERPAEGQPFMIRRGAGDKTPDEISGMDDAAASKYFGDLKGKGIGTQYDSVVAGMKLSDKHLPELQKLHEESGKKMMDALQRGDQQSFEAEFGKNVWYAGAIEGARRQGPNYERLQADLKNSEIPGLPPVPHGTIRLYHGEGGPEGAGMYSQWFSEDPSRAASYGGQVSYVDIPESVAQFTRSLAKKAGSGTAGDHFLPDEWTMRARAVPAKVQQNVYDLGPAALRRKGKEDLILPPGAPKVNAFEIERGAYAHLQDASDRALAEYDKAPDDPTRKIEAPSFRDFTKALQDQYGKMPPGAMVDLWQRATWKRLLNASGRHLQALRQAFKLRSKLGDRDIAEPPAKTTEGMTAEEIKGASARQKYRNNVITHIAEAMIKDAIPIYNVGRKTVTPEDIGFNRKSIRKAWNTITKDERENPTLLGSILTDDAREEGFPVSTTKRLTVLQNIATGKVEMVSTFRDGRRGPVMLDPDHPNQKHQPIEQVMKRWRPVQSVLLDSPVKNFRQGFKNLIDFEENFGKDARSRSLSEVYSEPEQTFEPEADRPGAWESRTPITDAEAGAILDSVFAEQGTFESPEDVKQMLSSVTLQRNRQAVSGLRKLAATLDHKFPALSLEELIDRLSTQIYENHKGAKSLEEFQSRTVSQGAPPSRQNLGARAQAPAAAPKPATQADLTAPVENIKDMPAMLRRTKQAVEDELALLSKDIVALTKRAATTQQIAAGADAAETIANNTARQAETGIRLQSVRKPAGLLARAFTGWAQGDRDILTAAPHIVEAGGVRPDGSIDVPAIQNALPIFRKELAKGRIEANKMLSTGGIRQRNLGRAWLREIDNLNRELNYLEKNINDPDLHKTASRIAGELENEYQREMAAGYDLVKDPNYLPHRWDAQLWNGRSILFSKLEPGRILGKKFREARRFETVFQAIAEGPYLRASADGASLASHRIRQGMTMMLRDKWAEGLKSIFGPDGRAIALQPVQLSFQKWGSPSADYEIVGMGGKRPLVIHKDFAPLLRNLTGRNVIQDWTLTRTALNLEQNLKHTLLVGDFFHFGRVSYYAASLMGKKAGWRGGWSVLDINPKDIPEAVRRGIIDQKTADWGNEPVNLGGKTWTRRQIAVRAQTIGLNVGKIQDALYKDLVTHLTPSAGPVHTGVVRALDPSIGRYNRFLFDKLTRGLMLESFVREIERSSKANPNANLESLARDVSRDINNYFGNIGRQGWLKAAWQQDLARMFLLAPQWVEGLIKKEAITYGRAAGAVGRGAAGLMGRQLPFRQGLPAMGTLGRGIGRGLGFMFLLTQAVNLISRRQPTWMNEEKEHKMDAFIPAFGGDEGGFWLSPFGLFNEITHDVYRLVQDKPKAMDAIDQIAGNKESPLVRAALVAYTGRSPTGTYLTTSGGQLATAAEQLAPVPITFGRYARAAGHALAPGLIDPNLPGQVQRQMYGTFGIKVEPSKSALQEVQKLARDFAIEKGRKESVHFEETDEPSYSRLRQAVRNNDPNGTFKMLDRLRAQGKTDDMILKAMKLWSQRNFTWSNEAEDEFRYSLTEEQRDKMSQAEYQRLAEYNRFLELFMSQPR